MSVPKAYQALVEALDRLPNIGPNAADRLAQHLLLTEQLSALQGALQKAQDTLQLCSSCRAISDIQGCFACAQAKEPHLLVVASLEHQQQALQIGYKGQTFVLHGLLSPVQGRGPKQLGIASLQQLIIDNQFVSIVVALDCSVEGQATAHFLQQLLSQYDDRLTNTPWAQWHLQHVISETVE